MLPENNKRLLIIGGIVILLIVLGMLYMSKTRIMGPKTEAPTTSASTTKSLGGELYEKANDPLSDKLPSQTPIANPINDAYKNPFQ